ncbi:hypothetical protein [Rheinheimera sp.]|uniref:hypothetical protein n=1 Tax=Rheinheimera sp. TaxID=1869214 RepID=UPI004048196E
MNSKSPLALVDLDDNLFQTARKMTESLAHVASRDVDGKPSGYMTAIQMHFINWLLRSADVVPVTARSTEAFSRVHIPFACGAVCTNGGVILGADGHVDIAWHDFMVSQLSPFAARLHDLSKTILSLGDKRGYSLRSWVVEEMDTSFYVVVKHNNLTDSTLIDVLADVEKLRLADDLTVHVNGNNLAFLPKVLSKKNAVLELLRRDESQFGKRCILGFGDSLSDLGFMTQCHFWGTPNNSQITLKLMGDKDE